MSNSNDIHKRNKNSFIIFSFVFLSIIIVLTAVVYIYNVRIKNNIDDINIDIQQLESSINEIKKDEKVKIYDLMKENEKTLKKMKCESKIPKYMEHFSKYIESKYRIKFKGFNYSSGLITTKVTVNSNNNYAYEDVVNFIKGYRKSPEALFDLDFIGSIKGSDIITFSISLKLKPETCNTVKKNNIIKK